MAALKGVISTGDWEEIKFCSALSNVKLLIKNIGC